MKYEVDIKENNEEVLVLLVRIKDGRQTSIPVSRQPFNKEGLETASRIAKFIQMALAEIAMESAQNAIQQLTKELFPKK